MLICSNVIVCFSQNWQLIKSEFPNSEAFVTAFSVKDFGATGDGKTDVTSIFQERLDALDRLGGGTLFVPKGKYVIKGNLLIPKGITLRGEWKKPVKGQTIEGTILMAYSGKGNENAMPFITMTTSSAVMDLAIWYPEQQATNIVPYPPSIIFGRPNYFGNEFCNAKNITLINSYTGVVFSRQNGGTCPVINGVYGSPLSRGVEIDNIVDVGRIEHIDFSPDYWAGSGVEGAPVLDGPHKTWIYDNGTGIVMRRNDWSYTSFINIEGYSRGFFAGLSMTSPNAVPNGHNYGMTFNGCKTAIYFEGAANEGIMFSKINIQNCNTGIEIGPNTSGTTQFHTCVINSPGHAVKINSSSASKFIFVKSKIEKGKVEMGGGTASITDCDFNNDAPQISLLRTARGIITGNRFSKGVQIVNTSVLNSIIDHTAVVMDPLPDFPGNFYESRRPVREIMYLVTDAPFNARPDGITDNTMAIQDALDKAFEDGGGYVFLPPGKYKVLGNLTVPKGVELKGSVDVSTTPTGPGSILEVYTGKNNASTDPFLKLSPGSGIRGITINYPEQTYALLPNPDIYPYCIQGGGNDVYIINVGIRATYNGIDLFTNKCDNHYIDFVTGHVLKNGINVGGGSENGKISNLQFNVIVFSCGRESKFGSWPNSAPQCDNVSYDYAWKNLDFITLGDCQNELLYNNFHYGSHRGVVFASENGNGPTGMSLGMGVDGARTGMSFGAGGTSGFDFINTQVVAIGDASTRYLETTSGFNSEIRLYNSDYWGNPGKGIVMNGGIIKLHSANVLQPGQNGLATLNSGDLAINNSIVPTGAYILNGGAEPKFSAHWSVIDPTGIQQASCAAWINNLSNTVSIASNAALSRSGWLVSAFQNAGSAKNAIDGNKATRWDSQGSQVAGQWFSVNFSKKLKTEGILLDVTGSPDDSPAAYEIYVSDNGNDWYGPALSGKGSSGLTVVSFPTTTVQYIQIKQTGTKGNYWSIHEMDVFGNADATSVGGITIRADSTRIVAGSYVQLSAILTPVNSENQTVFWISDNPSIATVDRNGKVNGLRSGRTNIKAITMDGIFKATVEIIVGNGVTGITGKIGEADGVLKVFPNPATSVLRVELNDVLKTDVVITIIDSGGRQLKRYKAIKVPGEKLYEIDISDLEPGGYIINCYTRNAINAAYFIVN